MPIFLDKGVNEVEDPILLDQGTLQSCLGAEYRAGHQGLFVARGRKRLATVTGVTWQGAYYAGFDDGSDWLVAQDDSNIQHGQILTEGISMTTGQAWGSYPSPLTGVHYGNRHYLVNEVKNSVGERDAASGITYRTPGMVKPTATLGSSVTQGASNFTVTTSLTYWHTEYDAVSGIESVAGATHMVNSFNSKTSVILTLSGASVNSNATHYNIYRTTDGGAFPEGGQLASIGVTNTSYTDSYTNIAVLLSPAYGTIQVNGLDFDRDVVPPVLSVIGSFNDSLIGFPANDRRTLRYTPAGYPESWPEIYATPLQTPRHDVGMGFAEFMGSVGVFTRDTIHRLTRLNREVDSVFAPGEAISLVSNERGLISRTGLVYFSPAGQGPRIAFVARDGIWMTNLDTVVPLTDGVDWAARVDITALDKSVLLVDPANRRLVFLYRKVGDTSNTGIMYLDYQRGDIRITFADHGPLATGVLAPYAGALTILSADSRDGNGAIYAESTQDRDDSELVDTSGSVHFKIRTSEMLPAGVNDSAALGVVSWLHSPGPNPITHRFYYDRNDDTPEIRNVFNWDTRNVTDVGLNRTVNSCSFEIESTGTVSYGLHFVNVQGIASQELGPSSGA